MISENGTVSKKVTAELRRYDMIELAKSGLTERQIANALKVSQPYVHKELKKTLSKMAKEHEGSADRIRMLQMQRYEKLLSAHWTSAIGSKNRETGEVTPPDHKSAELVMRIIHKISEINGVIPDSPAINIDNRSIQMNTGELVFSIEEASGRTIEGIATTIDD